MYKITLSILLILLMMLPCWKILNAQTPYTVSDSIIFREKTHLDDTLFTWDKVVVYLYQNRALVDSTVLAHTDTGTFTGAHAPLSKGIYGLDFWYWLDDAPTGKTEHFIVIDPADFMYSGAACNAPTGANQVDITIKNSADSTAIATCLIQLWNYDQSTLIWWDFTNSLGQMSFMYDDDSLIILLSKSLYGFTIPETLWVDGAEDTTYYGSTVPIGPPVSPDLCRVWGQIADISGEKDTAYTISAEITTKPLWFGNVLISPYYKETNPDTSGIWFLDLYPNLLLIPSTTTYEFKITDDILNKALLYDSETEKETKNITVPDQDTSQFVP